MSTTPPDLVLASYLQDRAISPTKTTPLENGSANWCWRVETTITTTNTTTTTEPNPALIIKHAAPYIKVAPAIPFPIARLALEARALRTIPAALASRPALNIHLPKLHDFDAQRHLLCMSDGGDRTLKEAYASLRPELTDIGRRLGRWLARLHGCTAELARGWGDNAAARQACGYPYLNASRALSGLGFEQGEVEIVGLLGVRWRDVALAEEDEEEDCVCHGDLCLSNVLVGGDSDDGCASASVSVSVSPRLTIIDWELVRRGCGATDVGQLAAEMWALEEWQGAHGLLGAFLEAYSDIARPTRQYSRRIAVHFGFCLIYWSEGVDWRVTGGCVKHAKLGLEVASKADDEDWSWFREYSPLGILFR